MDSFITKTINIVPDKSLIPKLGRSGYTIAQAISELVDNAIDARFEDKLLTVLININEKYIEVVDDGLGMDEKTASKCLKLAYSGKKNQLGEFGLGLKTATTSLGKKLTVITKQLGASEEFILEYDEDEWIKNGKWEKHPMKIRKNLSESYSGTKVRIENLIIKYYPNLKTKIREELSLRYAPFIENGVVIIKINNTDWCKPTPLELTPEGKDEFVLPLKDGNIIRGWRGLLLVGSNKGYYGFNTFKGGRLITQFDKIGFEPHPEVRQIVGELHLDHIPVTHNKREFIKESYAYQIMEDEMKIFMKPFVAKARKTARDTTIIGEKLKEKMAVQMDIIARALNKIPELKEYALPQIKDRAMFGEDKHFLEDGVIAKVEIEKRKPSLLENDFDNDNGQSLNKERHPKNIQRRKRCVVFINGKRYKFSHEFRDFQDDSFWKDKNVTTEGGVEVFTNTAFPAFMVTTDRVFYATMHVAEAIAEVAIEEKGESKDKIFFLRDAILRQSSQITREVEDMTKMKKDYVKLEKDLETKKTQIDQLHKDLGF